MKIFAQNLARLMPDWVTLPPALITTFDWLEDQGGLRIRGAGAPHEHSLSIYPPELQNHPNASHVAFAAAEQGYTAHWEVPDPQIDTRIAQIATTSGDGGRVAIWRDDGGTQHFVHIGHDTLGILTDDPLVLLQFLAMGYPEPGALPLTGLTPSQAFLDAHGVARLSDLPAQDHPVPPTALQGFLKREFGLDMPRSARDIGIADFAQYHDDTTSDPFALWLGHVTPDTTQAELEYLQAIMRTVDSLDLKDDDTSETIMRKIGTLFHKDDDPK